MFFTNLFRRRYHAPKIKTEPVFVTEMRVGPKITLDPAELTKPNTVKYAGMIMKYRDDKGEIHEFEAGDFQVFNEVMGKKGYCFIFD